MSGAAPGRHRLAAVERSALASVVRRGWGLAELGWNKAIDATEHPDPAKRELERTSLD